MIVLALSSCYIGINSMIDGKSGVFRIRVHLNKLIVFRVYILLVNFVSVLFYNSVG